MDMTKEQPQPSGTGQTSSPDNPTPAVGKVVTRESLGRRGFFADILSRLKGEDPLRKQDTDHNQLVNTQASNSGRMEDSKRSDSPLSLNRRQFSAAAGAAAALFATNPEKALAQLGGVGPDGAPPPPPEEIPPQEVILSRSQLITPEAIQSRKAQFKDPSFVRTYEGRASDAYESAAGDYFKTVLASFSGYQGVGEVARSLSDYAAVPRNPATVTPDNVKIVKKFGPEDRWASLLIGILAPDWDNCIGCWPGIDPDRAVSTNRGVSEYINRFGEKVPALEIGLLIGRKKDINPNDLGALAQTVLFPYYYIKNASGYFDKVLSQEGGMSVEKAKEVVLSDTSEFAVVVEQLAWGDVLDRVDVLMQAYSNWDMSQEFTNFYNSRKVGK